MRKPDIDTTFAAIRQAPMEVDFERIQQFVLQQSALSSKSVTHTKKWFNSIHVSILIVALSAIIAAWILTHKIPEQDLPGITTVNLPDLKPIATEHHVLQKTTVPTAKKTMQAAPLEKAEEQGNPVLFTNVKKTGSLIHPPAAKTSNSIPDQSMNTLVLPEKEEQDTTPIRVRTYTSNYCTFDGEDIWIKAFLKALISDYIIKDSINLRFTLTLNSFTVNGLALNEEMVKKYTEIYTFTTQKSLNEKSAITLSVGGSSCTLSKVIDE